MERIVVVGAGLAGHRGAIALRKEGFEGTITVIGDEEHRPYDRPPLSKQLLAGDFEHDDCFFKEADVELDWKLGSAAAALDPGARTVTLADGEELSYDGLMIATGRAARPWKDPVKELGGLHTLRSLDDCVAFKEEVQSASGVAIVGAGFIGCEVAATLRTLGVENVTLIDVLDQPMAPVGVEVGRWLAGIHEQRGVDLRLGVGVEGFEGDGRVTGVALEGGDRVEADVVLLALGSVPNSEWLEGSGLDLDRGSVVCDQHLFADGHDDIVAVGDIAAWVDSATGDRVSVEHWTNAREMAEVAAHNLVCDPGEREAFTTVPTFWSDQYDLKIKSAGHLARADEFSIVEEDPEKPSLVAEARAGGEVVGAVTVNRNKKMIEYTRGLRDAGEKASA